MPEERNSLMHANGVEVAVESAEYFINKGYMDHLVDYTPIPLPKYDQSYRYIRLCQIEKIVYDKEEDVIDKLVSVYGALSQFVNHVVLFIVGEKAGVTLYLGVRSKRHISIAEGILADAFIANFPGSFLKVVKSPEEIERIIGDAIDDHDDEFSDDGLSVECISVTPSMRGEKQEAFVQGLEKFIDTMRGQEYVCEIIASPLSRDETDSRRRGYEEIAAALSPFEKTTLAQGQTDTRTLSEGITDTVSTTISKGISMATGTTSGFSKGKQSGFNLGASFLVNFGFNEGTNESVNSGKSRTETETETEAKQSGRSTQISRASSEGTSETCTTEYKNKSVEELLKKLDLNLERLREGDSYGLWECAAYMISKRKQTVAIASGTFKSLMLGEKSNAERAHTNFVSTERKEAVSAILSSLRFFEHPRFRVPASDIVEEQIVRPTNIVNGHELPLFLSMPRHSLPGVVVTEMTGFGRNVFSSTKGETIQIGNIYYMDQVEETPVDLDVDSLTAHCFITGSTGSGKSNTVYSLLERLGSLKSAIPFLVIEPAKGEYRKHFGALPGIKVFCTNSAHGQLLKINPFRFPEEVHILEHLDRLVEIFNACWEMYAAMPAILKDAIERSYIAKGWDLLNSVYTKSGDPSFPTFADLLTELPKVIKQSSYSADTQGDYTGALVTRVNSLTNGIYGQIFCDDFDIPDNELFDSNTIVDLSRVGSTETKSLIMGMLVLHLTEYRMSSPIPMNSGLRHVTVLEEAHNLLKNTAGQHGTAGNQVVAKSVEMIVNSIAEMRTYGEGFFIVDQSPTSVDIAAVKNTNTKIVMRLPEKDDCDLVGRSVSLKDGQIEELSRLKVGKAVVMQSNWSEAVLAQIFPADNRHEYVESPLQYSEIKAFRGVVLSALLQEYALSDSYNANAILEAIERFDIRESAKESMKRTIKSLCGILDKEFDSLLLGRTLVRIAGCSDAFRIASDQLKININPPAERVGIVYTSDSVDQWHSRVKKTIDQYVTLDDQCRNIMIQYMIYAQRFEKHEIDYNTIYHDIYEIR